QGLHLNLMGSDGSINTSATGPIAMLTQTYFVPVVGWFLVIVALLAYLVSVLAAERRRGQAGLPYKPLAEVLFRAALLAVPLVGGVWILNQYKGVPLAFLI